ncbi:pectinesterase-like [Humulus lupulus]|uniref:pectinesterase-like n=1 Tax=Humulus lupulus TaxID=3486 RepID=UPI002B40AB1B|nr:pectinesterase-like [Humulus lupulus]
MSGKVRIAGLASVNTFTVRLVITVVVAVSLQISSGQLPFGHLGGFGGGVHTNGALHGNLPSFSTASHAATIFCGTCAYKDACIGSIGSMVNNPNANPKDFFQAAIQSSISQVSTVLNVSGSIAASSSGSKKMFMEDCQELLGFAVDELHACFSTVGGTDLNVFRNKQAELLNWLSAVVSYQHTCLDGIFDSQLKTEIMSNGLSAANQLASNALAIVSTIGGKEGGFGFKFTKNSHGESTVGTGSRRLKEVYQSNGEPSWLSGEDRKLLGGNNGNGNLTPNKVVAKDGSGDFKTIGEALSSYPKNHQGRYTIYVKAGIYNEYLTVTKEQVNVFIYGDGPRKTIITGRKNFNEGVSTFRTATFSAIGKGFVAKSIGFQNTAGPEGHQAVALRVQSDMSAFYNCRIDGYQDSLYVQTHRQFYHNCVISGTVDFIFGDAAAVIQNSLIIVRKPGKNQKNAVTAQGRVDQYESTGIVIQNCRIVPEQKLISERLTTPTYLGRPWKEYSRTVIMESTIEDLIQPAGWMEWDGDFALNTLYYAEYANRGPGAATNQRVKWKGYKVITNRNEAMQFTAGQFLQGNLWLGNTGAPFFLGLKH